MWPAAERIVSLRFGSIRRAGGGCVVFNFFLFVQCFASIKICIKKRAIDLFVF